MASIRNAKLFLLHNGSLCTSRAPSASRCTGAANEDNTIERKTPGWQAQFVVLSPGHSPDGAAWHWQDHRHPAHRRCTGRPGKRVLYAKYVPAGRIADVNRGILMPISRAVGDFTFTIAIDVSDAEGIARATLENTIGETIRQIGGRIVSEERA
jgi:hypothetical protein